MSDTRTYLIRPSNPINVTRYKRTTKINFVKLDRNAKLFAL